MRKAQLKMMVYLHSWMNKSGSYLIDVKLYLLVKKIIYINIMTRHMKTCVFIWNLRDFFVFYIKFFFYLKANIYIFNKELKIILKWSLSFFQRLCLKVDWVQGDWLHYITGNASWEFKIAAEVPAISLIKNLCWDA